VPVDPLELTQVQRVQGPDPAQAPPKRGGRFSLNAAIPSAKSPVSAISR
jgi:hypothetical protein